MQKIKVFAFPSHGQPKRTSGVDFARIIQPMNHLAKHKDFEVKVWDPTKDKQPLKKDILMFWDKIGKEYDIIYLNYTIDSWGFAAIGSMVKRHGKLLVMDVDDNLWNISEDNAVYQTYKKGSQGLHNVTSIVNAVDYLTTTNTYLRNVLAANTKQLFKNIQIFPNYIDLDIYKYRPKPKSDLQVQALHFGSTTHFRDLATEGFLKGVDKIMKEYPNFIFKTVGAMLPEYKRRWGPRYVHAEGDPDIYKWINEKYPTYMEESDFGLVPLTDNIYNRSKSFIKFLEMSVGMRVGCWQRIRQYEAIVKDGVNGFLCYKPNEWYQGIKTFLDKPQLRDKMAQNAFETIQDYTIQVHVEDYANYFKEILDKQKADGITKVSS